MPKVKCNEIAIYYEILGTGEPVLLISGTGGNSQNWMPTVKACPGHYQYIIPHNRGTGLSDWPEPPYSVPELARDMAELLNALGISKVHVVGKSLGSAIAQELAIRFPQRVHTVLLLTTWDQTVIYPHLRQRFELCKALLERGELDLYVEFTTLTLFSPHFVNQHPDLMVERKREILRTLTPKRVKTLIRHYEVDLAHNTTGRLCQIQSPTLIVAGDHDIVTLLDYNKAVQTQIPRAEMVVLKGAGHALMLEVPETLGETISRFLARHPM